MDLQTVTLEDALKLLSLPRVVGVDPAIGEEITAQNGRYGPYLKRGTDSRSLATEDQMFTITLDEALKIYAEPKRRGGQGAAAPPLRELGTDPASGKPMVIKDGRFGPYVTDGETNASLRKGDDVVSITDERAVRAAGRPAGPGSGEEDRQEGHPQGAGQEGRRRKKAAKQSDVRLAGYSLDDLLVGSKPLRGQPDSAAGPAGWARCGRAARRSRRRPSTAPRHPARR